MSMRIHLAIVLALAVVGMGAGTDAAAAEPARAEVPIRLVTLPDGARRYAVPLTIGGAAIEAGLDTGSTGLRVMERALAPAAAGGPRHDYRYSSGVTLAGPIVRTSLAFGPDSAEAVPVQRIAAIGCTADHRGCAGERLGLAAFGLQGDGIAGAGFAAILGLDMADDPVRNPLVAMGVMRWIVELPRNEGETGRLILDPDEAEMAGFARIPLIAAFASIDGGVHDALPGCIMRADGSGRLCAPILFDSGAPGLRLSLEKASPWPNGTEGMLIVGEGKAQQGLRFTVGRRDQASAMTTETPMANARPHISAGLMPYFGWSVLYDAKRQEIGLKPR